MTAKEVFKDLNDKYGEDFNWHMLPLTNKTFVTELKKEIGAMHFLYEKDIRAVAKCDSNDDVLYLVRGDNGEDKYYIFHLTYSENNAERFPKGKEFNTVGDVKDYVEQSYVTDYM